jgi:hypothetical protein
MRKVSSTVLESNGSRERVVDFNHPNQGAANTWLCIKYARA